MTELDRFDYKFVIWSDTGNRVAGSGVAIGADKNSACRRIKTELSIKLSIPPADINVTSLRKVKK